MNKILLLGFSMLFILCSCGNSKKEANTQKRKIIHVVRHESEMGKNGEGTYINSNTHYKDENGTLWHRDNIFAPRPKSSY